MPRLSPAALLLALLLAPAAAALAASAPAAAQIASSAMLLRLSVGREDLATAVEQAIGAAVRAGSVTPDMGGTLSTQAVTESVLARLGELVPL